MCAADRPRAGCCSRLNWPGNVGFWRAPCKGGAFQWVQAPPGKPLQPEAIGAVMEVTKWLKPSISVSQIGGSASVQAATRVNAEQASKRTMCRPTDCPYRRSGHRYLSTARRFASPAASASMAWNPPFRANRSAIILVEICDLGPDKLTRRANHFGFSEIVSSPESRIKNIPLSPSGKSAA